MKEGAIKRLSDEKHFLNLGFENVSLVLGFQLSRICRGHNFTIKKEIIHPCFRIGEEV